jgi:hypothetical protein
MKPIKLNNPIRSIFFCGISAFIVFSLISCARKMTFQNSSVVPAAEGKIKIKKDRNKNYNIDLSTVSLAEPSRLSPPRSMYVVWMSTEQNGTKKVGQLKTSASLLSKTLKSSLKTSVPYNPTGFFITAEDDINVPSPSEIVVLSTTR